MRFSICIPTFQRLPMLRGALESALGQDLDDFEVVVSDNASSDGTASYLQGQSHPRLRCLIQPSNVGSVANHNQCVTAARGEWIVFLHDDDQLSGCALTELARYFDAHPSVDVALPPYMEYLLHGALFRNCLRLLNGISMSSTVYRRSLLVAHPFALDNVCCDWEILFVAAMGGYEFGCYPREFLNRGHHPDQEGSAVMWDGRGLAGKAMAVSRLHRALGPSGWLGLCQAISAEWTADELMTFARYVHHGTEHAGFTTLRGELQRRGRWRRWSRSGAVITSEGLIGRALTALVVRAGKRILRPLRSLRQRR
jgi:cellulose synthase/poly-beta-1,6-N-acetylglucosamine synthase-like glycosyltransferase